ncbi:Exopolyphosphatase [Geranomyces michiganensis]|nr:Exopolyphosphatase [Geranomyces michiganensis]
MVAAPTASRLARFLARTKTVHASAAASPRVTVVIGNEAADLDSLVSAVSYAYLKSTTAPPGREYVPVVSIPRCDFALRTECPFTLRRAFDSVDIEALLTFMDEIDLDALLAADRLEMVLVDHNKLAPSLERFASTVVGVIDHHTDEELYKDAEPRLIRVVGSATSLVAEQWMAQSGAEAHMEPGLATAMIAAVLIDTVNLVEEYARVTEDDRRAVKYLLPFARNSSVTPSAAVSHTSGVSGGGGLDGITASSAASVSDDDADKAYIKTLYNGVHHAKVSISGLPSSDLLRKDYKEWVIAGYRLGISSVSWHITGSSGWAARDGFTNICAACSRFAANRDLDLHIIMTAFDHSSEEESGTSASARGFERELLVNFYGKLASEPAKASAVLAELEKQTDQLELQLVEEPWCSLSVQDSNTPSRLYLQHNIRSSRKQVQPIMERILAHL